MKKCERCDGTGYVLVVLKPRSVGISAMGFTRGEKIPCPSCNGKGRVGSAVDLE